VKTLLKLLSVALAAIPATAHSAAFDAAPFALPLPAGTGLQWEDPREIHRVVVHFASTPPTTDSLHVQYWGSRWPNQHLPKDSEPGGADVGWMELGNWHQGGWRTAETRARLDGNSVTFEFAPVNASEFPDLKDYPATFRYTLKIRITADQPLPRIQSTEAFTDSTLAERTARVVWKKPPVPPVGFGAFNGSLLGTKKLPDQGSLLTVLTAHNPDPNTFDRTLVAVSNGPTVFTFSMDDLATGPLFIKDLGAAVLPGADTRDYAAVAAAQKAACQKTLYDRIAEMPEQTWQNAWAGLPRKKSDIYLPLGLDGGRQRFLLEPDGTVRFRVNDRFLTARPGSDTVRLKDEPGPVCFRFGPPRRPAFRTLEEGSLPVCQTTWESNGVRITQTAFVTQLQGATAGGPVPEADATAVLLARFTFTNTSSSPQPATLPLSCRFGETVKPVRLDASGNLAAEKFRGQVICEYQPTAEAGSLTWTWALQPGETKRIVFKIPYLVLKGSEETDALHNLDFDRERAAVTGYWHRRLDESARLITPEPMLNDFYRAQAGHLLINCEREPRSERRFARVGSFFYGAFGNESCMMVVDLDRRGYHREAQECLEAWLHYQGSVALPGDFDSKKGVLYGAGGYEDGGYNQHHGWILWMLAEHFRFTRDYGWLRSAAPGIIAGADWIVTQAARTTGRHPLERGLLPAGSLEDIGDWWTWLSTSCYSWRGLDSAAWALEQIRHPEAARLRREANAFHAALLANFRQASNRSPVVRLRDGTAVPKIPSHVHRRGRSFGWICETLEGSLHLLITKALDARSPQGAWIVKDYEDNLYLSNQYGYTVDNFDKWWFSRGGMSMQACLLLNVEPYLYRDDVKHALRALFNGQAVSYFPDVRMNTEHAAPYFDDWRGDHYKSSDESNCAGWLRQLFLREEGDELFVGQAVPRDWLKPGQTCGIQNAATYFGKTSVLYTAETDRLTAAFEGAQRNGPKVIHLRFRPPTGRQVVKVTVNGRPVKASPADWIELPGNIGKAEVIAKLKAL
jgi:hypothetical protein